MIQRIQSLFLLIVSITTLFVMFTPLLSYTDNSSIYKLVATGLKAETGELVFNTFPLLVLSGIAFLFAAISIALYKKRMLQIRLSIFGLVLQLGFYGLLYYMHYQIGADTKIEFLSFHIPSVFPVVNAILLFLTIRAIGKDEALVRSLDRIR